MRQVPQQAGRKAQNKQELELAPSSTVFEASERARMYNVRLAGLIEVLFDVKFLLSNAGNALIVDSSDAKNIFKEPGYYKIDRANGMITRAAYEPRYYIWHNLVYVSREALDEIEKGNSIVMMCNNWLSNNGVHLDYYIPKEFSSKSFAVLSDKQSANRFLTEMRRAELIDEVETARKERDSLSKNQ